MLMLLIRLSALSLGLSCVACTTSSSQTQLASLNERMNQMLSALYASPLLSKPSTSTSSAEEITSTTPETSYIVASGPPQVVYVSPSPYLEGAKYLEAGAQPNDYGYPVETHPVARSAWPYPYEYSYPQYPPAVPTRYPEAPRPYLPVPSPTSPALPSPFPPVPYSPLPYSYPSQAPTPFPATLPTAPVSYSPIYPPVPQPQSYSPAPPFPGYPTPCSSPYSLGYPASPYPAPTLASPQYPGFPTSLPSPAYPPGYPSAISPVYPTAISPGFPPLSSPGYPPFPVPGVAPQGYPSSGYTPVYAPSPYLAPAYPKYSEVLHHPFDFNKI